MNDTYANDTYRGLRSLVRAHLWYGAAGFILGVAAALAAINFGPEFMSAEPFFTTLALGMVGTIAVSMLGGLLTFVPAMGEAPGDD